MQLLGAWVAVAQTNQVAGSDQPGPVTAISPSGLDFGLVGVGRTKDLLLTVKNAGGGTLAGTATVSAPFSIVAGSNYSLGGNQSQRLTVRYGPTAEGTDSQLLVFSGGSAATVPVTGSARTPPPPPGSPRITGTTSNHASTPAAKTRKFAEEEEADFIARYYTDEVSYALKPAMMDGVFRSICDRALLLKLAGQQPRRELAVVVLIHYPVAETEDATKLAWVNDLTGLGYRRIVFLRSGNRMQVNGLPILEGPPAAAMSAGQ